MARSRRERRLWWLALASLPLLAAASLALDVRRNVTDYLRRIEWTVHDGSTGQPYAGAVWRVEKVRLLGDGRDTKMILPGDMRLVVLRLVAIAGKDIGEGWADCRITLADNRDRRWAPLDFILSESISRDLEPDIKPVEGCNAIARNPPARDGAVMIEEKFVVPGEAVPSLAVRISFAASRPEAIGFPLGLR